MQSCGPPGIEFETSAIGYHDTTWYRDTSACIVS